MQKIIFIIGDGRSGTTWLTRLINKDNYYREIFEPFHPSCGHQKLSKFGGKYYNPTRKDLARIKELFTGKIENPRKVMSPTGFSTSENILIKDIHTCLNIGWIYKEYSFISPIVIIRNPFSVAVSKIKKKSWGWELDIDTLLNETPIIKDYLGNYLDVINEYKKIDDFIVQQILIWCIHNRVMLDSLKNARFHVVRYEKLCLDFDQEMLKISTFIENTEISITQPNIPSMVTDKTSKDFQDGVQLKEWEDYLSKAQIKTGKEIIQKMNLKKFI